MLPVARFALLLGFCGLPAVTTAQDVTAIEGLWCHEKNAFAVIEASQGIEFALFSSRNGTFCSARGVAKPGRGGWIYRSEAAEEPCEIRLTASAEGVRLSTPNQQATCYTYCGISNQIDGLTFPARSRVSRTGNRQQLETIDLEGLGPCLKRR